LLLRPFELKDAPTVRRLAGDRAIADTTLNIPHPCEEGRAAEWIRSHGPGWERGEGVHFAIVTREGEQLIGAGGLVITAKHDRATVLGSGLRDRSGSRGPEPRF
jgi:hypothetical protein